MSGGSDSTKKGTERSHLFNTRLKNAVYISFVHMVEKHSSYGDAIYPISKQHKTDGQLT